MSRIKLLQSAEITRFDEPPIFTADERAYYFSLPVEFVSEYSSLRSPYTKAGFLLQLGYFRNQGRFYETDSFHSSDIEYLSMLHKLSLDVFRFREHYPRQTSSWHRERIRQLSGWRSFSEGESEFTRCIELLIDRQLLPRKVLWETKEYLFRQRIEAPGYNTYLRAITQSLIASSRSMAQALEAHITSEDKILLDCFLEKPHSNRNAEIVAYKKISQSTQPRALKASLELFKTLKDRLNRLEKLVSSLQFSNAVIDYHAYWVSIADTQKLALHSDKYLFLLCFLIYQVRVRNDFFVDVLLGSVKAAEGFTERLQAKTYFADRKQRDAATRILVNSRQNYRQQVLDVRTIMRSPLPDPEKLQAIAQLLEVDIDLPPDQEGQLQQLEAELKVDETESFLRLWEKRSMWLSHRVGDIMQYLSFNSQTTDKALFEVITHYQLRKGKVQAPYKDLSWLKPSERAVLYQVDETDNTPKFRGRLYKMFLFRAVAAGVKSGKINFLHSYRYRSLDEYLISKTEWEQFRETLLSDAELTQWKDWEPMKNNLQNSLDEQFHQTNQQYLKQQNPHLTFGKDSRPFINTPAVDKPDFDRVAHLFKPMGLISISSLLSQIETAASFLHLFGYQGKTEEKQRPTPETFFAAIIALGSNIGVEKMSRISKGIQASTLKHTADWYLTQAALQDANDVLIRVKNELALPELHRKTPNGLHTASDGQKVLVRKDSLHASYSYKYPGFTKAFVVNTAIDERLGIFHSQVLVAAEREHVGMVDMHLGNSVIKSTIHSTDTHGSSGMVFGLMHFLEVFYAPRLKDIGDRTLYSFRSIKDYAALEYPILPDKYIDVEIIGKHWDDLLRLMASLKLGRTTAFQLFKRLNSYSKQNPLEKALKELGRAVQTSFILRYFDDVALRQAVEKQLSHIEMMNRFSKAVFFGQNQEFNVATKEEQERIILCRRLLQNAIILWNYLFLSELLVQTQQTSQVEAMVETIRQATALIWQHVNFLGEYDFSNLRNDNQKRFDINQLKTWSYKSATA